MPELTKTELLNVRRLPARLDTNQTAFLLGFQHHDIPILIKEGLLKPLGKPKANAPKWFAMTKVLALGQDEEWLSKATDKISKNWAVRNQQKRPTSSLQA
jgi:hypothetical protein